MPKNRNDTCTHPRFEIRSACADCGKELGRQEVGRQEVGRQEVGRGLSAQEMQAQEGTALPDREAMSLANINLAAPINLAAALNVLSDGSIAYAGADQIDPIIQQT
jgi:hypothetical protein